LDEIQHNSPLCGNEVKMCAALLRVADEEYRAYFKGVLGLWSNKHQIIFTDITDWKIGLYWRIWTLKYDCSSDFAGIERITEAKRDNLTTFSQIFAPSTVSEFKEKDNSYL
jgi:hypothetical protein